MASRFDRNVFINCPFDDSFLPLLKPLLFTVLYVGFNPRIALESKDSGQPRINKLVKLIEESRFAIHDLSRLQAVEAGEYFRLNMPFELGLDVGCRFYGRGNHLSKKCLILEAEPYRYQAALSDIAGQDIAVHGNDPGTLVVVVRNWLHAEAGLKSPGPARIWDDFSDFMAANHHRLLSRGFSHKDIERLPINELMKNMKSWIRQNK